MEQGRDAGSKLSSGIRRPKYVAGDPPEFLLGNMIAWWLTLYRGPLVMAMPPSRICDSS